MALASFPQLIAFLLDTGRGETEASELGTPSPVEIRQSDHISLCFSHY
jgi:hypothetical protein